MKLWKEFLSEKDDKIYPKSKTAASWFAITPASDIALAGIGARSAFKIGKKEGKAAKQIAKDMGIHAGKAALMSLGAFTAYRIIRSWFDKCERECGREEMNTPKRQLCKLNCNRVFIQKNIQLLKKNRNENPEKFDRQIIKLNNKLMDINKKIILYKKYLAQKQK